MADAGYLVPHWPRAVGPRRRRRRAARHRRGVRARPASAARTSQVGAWVLPTLIAHGTPEQQERWIAADAARRADVVPAVQRAGRRLATSRRCRRRRSRVDGGWLLTGQKVWTSMAHEADWGICLARTDPTVPKHDGITCFLVDMQTEGIDIRPLRELTGAAMFNEVFLADVFVPDDCVVGAVDDGWRGGPHHARPTSGCRWAAGRRSASGSRCCSACVDRRRRRRSPSTRSARCSSRRRPSPCSALRIDAAGAVGRRARAGVERAQAARRRARPARAGGRARRCSARPARPTDGDAARGSPASSPTAASPSPAAPARSSATSSPNASSACPRPLTPSAFWRAWRCLLAAYCSPERGSGWSRKAKGRGKGKDEGAVMAAGS